jgi:transposase-like protein/IS1 family transposase
MTCVKCQHGNLKRFGTYGRKRIQRYRCLDCGATFSETRLSRFADHYLSLEKTARIVKLMVEGMSVRAISRITGTDPNTILSILLTVGQTCSRLFNSHVRRIQPRYVQLDELWCFVHTKEKRVKDDDPAEWGDAYTWIALDAETKLTISYLVAKRDARSAMRFVKDLGSRVRGRFQVTTDGFKAYVPAMEETFGADVDFAQLVKVYGSPENTGPDWYGPAKVIEMIPTPITGNPDEAHICTSHVERANLSVRMHLRRFTRLTNGFSKNLLHLRAAVDLYMAFYNFCRVHRTLRVTPAMEAKITDHVWSVQELLGFGEVANAA